MNKKIFTLALFSVFGITAFAQENAPLESWDFGDPTSFPAQYAKGVAKYKNVKAFTSDGYPMIIAPVQRKTDKPLNVKVKAAADPAVSPLAKIGVLVQVQNPKTKKYLSGGMQIKQLTTEFADYNFEINPAKLGPNKNFRLLLYCFGRKGKIYLATMEVSEKK